MGSPWGKAHPRYAPKVERPVPAWDPQDYSDVLEPSGVDFLPSFEKSVYDGEAATPPIAWRLFAASVLAFASTHAARVLAPLILSSWGVPVLVAAALLWSGYVYWTSQDAQEALYTLFLLPLAITSAAFASTATESSSVRLVPLVVSLFVAGVFVDSIGGHALTWRLKDLAVGSALRERWLAWWRNRFDAANLRAQAAAASSEARSLSECGRNLEALSRRIDAAYLLELASYRGALAVLLIAGILSLLPGSLATLCVVPLALTILWVSRAPLPASPRLLAFAVRQAFRTWLYFGIRGGLSADTWKPTSGEPTHRILLLGMTLVLLSAALLPETHYGSKLLGAAATPRGLWHLIFQVVGEIVAPLLVILSALVAALGRFLAQVEYAPFTKETPK